MSKLISISVLSIIIFSLFCYYKYMERIGKAKVSNVVYATIWGLIIILIGVISYESKWIKIR